MQKTLSPILISLIFPLLFNCAFAQVTSILLDDKSYTKENGEWYVSDMETSTKFEVNKQSITVKQKEESSKEEFLKLTEANGV